MLTTDQSERKAAHVRAAMYVGSASYIDVHYVEEDHIKNNNSPSYLSSDLFIERLKSVRKR